ncbi:MAG: tRNA glutamyl-Q(34) synthetase GluQRS [Alphaproteobacteria bacterium]|nr:tRNA glutamyl-Q(34) synthetase GluQRS [Alphaproteobacteria bacterium]
MPDITRFAPSPTGRLHLGHAYAAWSAAEAAGAAGRFLLRIEDIDASRCRPEFEAAILEDLAWLGLKWQQSLRRQSEHLAEYAGALGSLRALDLLYPCFCTRREIQDEIARAPSAPHGPDGPAYPGRCRVLAPVERAARIAAGEAYALRLDLAAALRRVGALRWHDHDRGWQDARPEVFGDIVLARKDSPASYHLAVVVDDAAQGVTLVTRGADLFPATHLHRLLQALLGLPVPEWRHHRLVADAQGKRLAKRDGATTLATLRAAGHSPDALRALAERSLLPL